MKKSNAALASAFVSASLAAIGLQGRERLDYLGQIRDLDLVCVAGRFVFHDRTGLSPTPETTLALDEFPSPSDLWARYRAWKGLSDEAAAVTLQDYFDDGSGKSPRYYQVYKEFSPDFFDLIVIDECHRGSAADDSAWREILDHFSSATQIGLTATPKETEYASNIDYFGAPVYAIR